MKFFFSFAGLQVHAGKCLMYLLLALSGGYIFRRTLYTDLAMLFKSLGCNAAFLTVWISLRMIFDGTNTCVFCCLLLGSRSDLVPLLCLLILWMWMYFYDLGPGIHLCLYLYSLYKDGFWNSKHVLSKKLIVDTGPVPTTGLDILLLSLIWRLVCSCFKS